MKIIIDNKIPFIKGVFEPYGVVKYIDGAEICVADLLGVDYLITRTRTICNEALLKDSAIKHIATATIGFDHIDMNYCASRGIKVTTAAGCNAKGVVQYIIAALCYIEKIRKVEMRKKTIGIVGVGNVGSALKEVLEMMNFNVICCDPISPKQGYVTIDKLIDKSDIITVHVPLTRSGEYKTEGLFDRCKFKAMREGTIFINSSRGEVIDEDALLSAKNISTAIIDVWNNEPSINSQLLNKALIATPHIAGYSLQGKAMGSAMVVRSIAETIGITELANWYPDEVAKATIHESLSWSYVIDTIKCHYDICSDSDNLKQNPADFERLRNDYQYREEYF